MQIELIREVLVGLVSAKESEASHHSQVLFPWLTSKSDCICAGSTGEVNSVSLLVHSVQSKPCLGVTSVKSKVVPLIVELRKSEAARKRDISQHSDEEIRA